MSAAAVEGPASRLSLASQGTSEARSGTVDGSLTDETSATPWDDGSRDLLINTMQLVEPRKQMLVPNHILDTKVYATVVRNELLEASPSVLHFAGFEIGKVSELKLDIINLSGDVQRMHVIPPQTKYFHISYTKNLRLVPGFALKCIVEFRPDEWRYYYDCIRVHCKGEDNLIIPIHAFPVMNTSDFPKFIDFAQVPVGDAKTKVFQLRCLSPINFEFKLTFLQSHPAFTVDPMAGTVPANGEVDISVCFSPTAFQTASAKLQLQISQFLSEPLICTLLGQSAPGLARDIALKSQQDAKPDDALTKTLDPGTVGALARARSRKMRPTLTGQSIASCEQSAQVNQRDGFVIPPNLDTPHAVAYVLNQKRGQLKMKHVQQALQFQKSGAQPMTRQMKETRFDMAVRQGVHDERQNQLRWQVKLGDKAATEQFQAKVLSDRKADWQLYKRRRGDPDVDEECCRQTSQVIARRTRRDASEVAPSAAHFYAYANDMWATRHAVLARFQQAARKVIIRCRMKPRLKALQKSLYEAADRASAPSTISCEVDITTHNSKAVDESLFDASRVTTVTFPVYVSPGVNDDLAVDALGSVSVESSTVNIKLAVPYFPLQVPQYSELYGYSRYDVQKASMSYFRPVSLKALRTRHEDDGTSQKIEKQEESEVGRGLAEKGESEPFIKKEVETTTVTEVLPTSCGTTTLCPPPALFQPVKYPELHIFNPAPGLLTLLSPLPYSEVDPDFCVCPLPRFVADDSSANRYASSQKRFLDRQDTIKGLMTWKKFSSPMLAATTNTPTLSNVWVPRWADPFNSELLPHQGPALLHGLSEEDKKNVVEQSSLEDVPSEAPVQLTMQMVKAEFAAMETACLQDGTKEDAAVAAPQPTKKASTTVQPAAAAPSSKTAEFPAGTKLPATNLPTSATGPVPRDQREADLDTFLQRKCNNLGRKINSRIAAFDQLKKDPTLILK